MLPQIFEFYELNDTSHPTLVLTEVESTFALVRVLVKQFFVLRGATSQRNRSLGRVSKIKVLLIS